MNAISGKSRTSTEVAKKIGVSENTYRAMKTVVEKGSPDQIARMHHHADSFSGANKKSLRQSRPETFPHNEGEQEPIAFHTEREHLSLLPR